MLPKNNADVTHCEKNSVFYFQNKVVYRAEDRPAHVCLKMTFNLRDEVKISKFLILVFSYVT